METFNLRIVYGCALGLLLVASTAARADDKADLMAAFDKAKAAEDKANYAEAAKQYEQALALAPKVFGESSKNTAVVINNLAVVYDNMGQYAQAELLFKRSLKMREAVLGPEDIDVAATLNSMGNLYSHMSNYKQAEYFYNRSLEIKEKKLGKDHPFVANSLNNLAIVYMEQGKYPEAASNYERALKIYEAKLGPDHPDLASNLNNLANLYRKMGKYAQAESLYQRSQKIDVAKFGADHLSVATDLYNLALLYKLMGQYTKSEPLYQRCLLIREAKLPADHPGLAAALDGLASLYGRMKEYAKAEPLYQRSLRIRETKFGPNHPDVASSLDNLGGMYDTLGQHAKAESLLTRSLEIRKAALGANHPDVASSLNNLGNLYRGTRQYAKAEPLFQNGLKIMEDRLGMEHPDVAKYGLHNLALLNAAQDRSTLAADEFDRARKIVRKHIAQVLPILGEKEQLAFLDHNDRKDFHVALTLGFNKASDTAIAARSGEWLANGKAVAQETLVQRAALGRDSADPKLAEIVKQLLATRTELAKFTNSVPKAGEEKAYRAELARLSEIEQALAKQLGHEGGTALPAVWVELDVIRKALPQKSMLVDIIRFKPVIFDARSDEEQFRPAHYAAWLTPSAGAGDVRVVDLGEADKIDAAVQEFQTALKPCQSPDNAVNPLLNLGESDAEQQLRVSLATVSKLVLAPLLPYISKKEELFVSPDAALWLVPWAALPLEDGKYSVESWNIHFVISARDLVAEHLKLNLGAPQIFANPNYNLAASDLAAALAAATGNKPIAPAANKTASSTSASLSPALPGHNLRSASAIGAVPPLPGTASEAAAISPSLQKYAGQPKLYADQQALEGVFKRLRSPRVLVLSTHGFFLPDQPSKSDDKLQTSMARGDVGGSDPLVSRDGDPLENPLLRCGLLLAACNNRDKIPEKSDLDDGVLTGMEIVGTDLRGTELVVLSACETGLGKVNNGEGVAGLRQAFQLAGAQAVVATLWQIPDVQSAQLMNDFFANLAAGQSKSDALRNAQLARIKARREKFGAAHPLFWAAFTLTGGN